MIGKKSIFRSIVQIELPINSNVIILKRTKISKQGNSSKILKKKSSFYFELMN